MHKLVWMALKKYEGNFLNVSSYAYSSKLLQTESQISHLNLTRIAANKTKTNEFETKTLKSFHQIIQAVLIALSYSTQWIFYGRDSGNFLCEIGF